MESEHGQRRRVHTGPLPFVPWSSLEPTVTLEHRLPQVFVLAFLVLLAIQGWLHA